MEPEEIDWRVQDLLDGILPEAEQLGLCDELRANPEARAIYRDHLHIQLALQLRARAAKHVVGIGDVVPIERIIRRQKRRSLRLAITAAAALLVLAGIAFLFIPAADPPVAKFKPGPAALYSLVYIGDGEAPPSRGQVLGLGSRLVVEQGAVEVEFDTGVRGVLRAPAELTVEAEGRVELAYGIAWFKVSQEAAGFQVVTPECLVTDFGTAFGVRAPRHHADEVHVFEGSVEISREGERTTVHANQARRVLPGEGFEAIPFTDTEYLTELPKALTLPTHLHWSFDGLAHGEITVDGGHPQAGAIHVHALADGEGPVAVAGKFGEAAAFDGSGDRIMTDWVGIGGDESRSVAFWIKIDESAPEEYDRTLVSWGARSGREANSTWSVRATNSYSTGSQGFAGGPIRPQVFLGGGWILARAELERGRWHHIAVSYQGKQGEEGKPLVDFYIDGGLRRSHYSTNIAVASHRLDTDVTGGESVPLLIGQSRSTQESCIAVLDELYIFDSPLSGDLVRLLNNPPDPNKE